MKAVEKQKLWDKYRKKPTPEIREQIILEYAPLVKIVAGRLSKIGRASCRERV